MKHCSYFQSGRLTLHLKNLYGMSAAGKADTMIFRPIQVRPMQVCLMQARPIYKFAQYQFIQSPNIANLT